MTADAVAALVAANRAVAHIPAHYGYDLDRPDERLFALAVLSMGTAAEAGAYIELHSLARRWHAGPLGNSFARVS